MDATANLTEEEEKGRGVLNINTDEKIPPSPLDIDDFFLLDRRLEVQQKTNSF